MKKTKIIFILIALLPFIDLITSIQIRNGILFTLGLITKGIIILVSLYYIFFKCQSKYKKWSLLYILFIFLYMIGYFVFKTDLISKLYFLTEIKYLLKIVFFPIVFVALFNYFSEYGFNKDYFIKSMKTSLILYILFLLVPLCMKTAFNSYFYDYQGFVGWFYSANEISIIVIMLLPFMYYYLDNHHKYNFFIALPIMYALSSIGTKGAMIGSVVVATLAPFFVILLERGKLNKKVFGSMAILLITFLFFFGVNKITVHNFEKKVDIEEFQFIETPKNLNTVEKEHAHSQNIQKVMNFLLSNRDLYFRQTEDIYNARFEKSYVLFGMGFSNTSRIQNQNIDKLIEIDYFDLYFHTGILSLIIILMPIIGIFGYFVYLLFRKKLLYSNIVLAFAISILICLVLCASGLSGHVLFYPAVSFYLILMCLFLIFNLQVFNKKILDENKIQILALHLNYGGIETVICNQANMLSENYNVQIISLYKSKYAIPYKLNDKITVTYLMNTISNKEELIQSLKTFNIFNIGKQTIKAIIILFNKKMKLRKAILNSDAKIIISSRKEFTKILTKYAQDDVITVSEEHNYHDNLKYTKSVIKSNKNVDYLLPASKELSDYYSSRCKCFVHHIPNTIGVISENINKLDNKKIVSVGRLDEVKGFDDLILIMSKVIKNDKDITLDIYGDGKEYVTLDKLIKEHRLENNVFLKGFIRKEELSKKLDEYSLFACTSHSESFGLAILEANSHGIPCIMFDDAKGPLEFVNDSNGIIIKNRNISNYTKEIVALFHDKNKLKKLGNNAYINSKKYDFDVCKDKLNEFIAQIKDNSQKRHTNVMFISSTGGHLNELLQLKELFNSYDYEIITEKTETTNSLKQKYVSRVGYLKYGNKHSLVKYLFVIIPVNVVKSVYYYLKYKPKFIITTGAHSAVFMCLFGKMMGSKIIYIETFANINSKTLSGKILYPFVDKFIIQWNSMKEFYPNATMGGWIF